MRLAAIFALLLATTAFANDVDVRKTAAGRVSLTVTSAPLSEVLDHLARETGMKVVYDGAPPRSLVRSRQVEDATPADAVTDVLEGLGVSYALRLDATGAGVDTLLVLGGTKGPSTPRPPVPPVRMPGVTNVPAPMPDEVDDEPPSERTEDPNAEHGGRGEDREKRPAPAGMPPVPRFPTGPIGPLTLPTPAPTPPPQPPPE
jgi:hypothetical protein